MGRFIVDDGSAGLSQSKLGMTVFGGLSTQGGLSATCADGEYVYFDGKVGIGTASPDHIVDIEAASDARLKVTETGGSNIDISAGGSGGHVTSDGYLDLRTGGANERLRVTSTGNVGIGTTAPGNLLHLVGGDIWATAGGGSNNASLLLGDSTDWTGSVKVSYSTTTSGMWFKTGGSYNVVIDPTGNVGIGTTAPACTLEISDTVPEIRLTDSDASGTPFAKIQASSGGLEIGADDGNEISNSNIQFQVDNSEAMRIIAGGNVGIGTTAPSFALHVNNNSDGLYLESTGNPVIRHSNGLIFEDSDGTDRVYFAHGGRVGIGTTAPSRALDVGGHNDGMVLPVGTTAQRPATYLSAGTMRFNSDLNAYEGYTGSAWGSLGGGNAFDGASIIRYNNQSLGENVTVGTPGSLSANGFTAGPITIEDGYTVTIEHGSNWTII